MNTSDLMEDIDTPPNILDSIDPKEIEDFQPVHVRFFETHYYNKSSTADKNLDSCVRIHTNRVCVVYLSERHTILQKNQRVKSANFKVNAKTDRLSNKMSGKGKRGAQIVAPNSVLCLLETEDNESYPVYAGVHGKLLEINEAMQENPNIVAEDIYSDGFVAIILPDLKKENSVSELIPKEEYNKLAGINK